MPCLRDGRQETGNPLGTVSCTSVLVTATADFPKVAPDEVMVATFCAPATGSGGIDTATGAVRAQSCLTPTRAG